MAATVGVCAALIRPVGAKNEPLLLDLLESVDIRSWFPGSAVWDVMWCVFPVVGFFATLYGLAEPVVLAINRCRCVWLWLHALMIVYGVLSVAFPSAWDAPLSGVLGYAIAIWLLAGPFAMFECWLRSRPKREIWLAIAASAATGTQSVLMEMIGDGGFH